MTGQPTGEMDRAHAVERLVVELGVAFQGRGVYPSGHPALRASVDRAVAAQRTLLDLTGGEETTFLEIEGQLLIDRVPIPEGATWGRGLLLAFGRHNLSGMTLLPGLDGDELERFLDSCHDREGPQPSRHLLIGQAGFAESAAPGVVLPARAEPPPPPMAAPEELAEGREDFAAVAAPAAANVDRLRSLVVALSRAAAGARLDPPRLATVNSGDREFLHGLATALGTLRLARALGVEGDRLHDLGFAALVHDVGRLERAPDGGEAPISAHPVAGAARLAAIHGVPEVAVVVAFEHHLRFDGEPSYPRLVEPRGPGAAAQIVAVADTWDTLRTRGGLPAAEAVALLRRRAGTFLNPDLVEVFAPLVGGSANAGGGSPVPP